MIVHRLRWKRRKASVGLMSILWPAPLAFLAFSLSYALQVITNAEIIGVLPYLLLIPGAAVYVVRMTRRGATRRIGFDSLDLFVTCFVVLSAAHILAGTALGAYKVTDATRLLLIYVGSAWVYVYVSRSATQRGLRAIMLAISLATAVIAGQWVYETYVKMVKEEITDFQRLSYEYQKRRNNLTDEEMNPSALGTQYRAHGLAGSHTVTGSLVAIGAFAVVTLVARGRLRQKFLVLGLGLVVLLVGLATTAIVSYVVLLPLALWWFSRVRGLFRVIVRVAIYSIGILTCCVILVMSTATGRHLLENSLTILGYQIQYVFGSNADLTSMEAVYTKNVGDYIQFAIQKPLAVAIGEGPVGYGEVTFARGGDVGVLDLAAGYGIPFTIYFFVMCGVAVFRGVKTIKRGSLTQRQITYVVFGCATILFLLISLVHYGVIFNKAIIVLFFLGLGLIRRYCPASHPQYAIRSAMRRDAPRFRLQLATTDRAGSQ